MKSCANKSKRNNKIISMFFFLGKKEPKSQEKVIGRRTIPDAAPLPFRAHARLLVLVYRKEMLLNVN
jgi:hypothetical protein